MYISQERRSLFFFSIPDPGGPRHEAWKCMLCFYQARLDETRNLGVFFLFHLNPVQHYTKVLLLLLPDSLSLAKQCIYKVTAMLTHRKDFSFPSQPKWQVSWSSFCFFYFFSCVFFFLPHYFGDTADVKRNFSLGQMVKEHSLHSLSPWLTCRFKADRSKKEGSSRPSDDVSL